MTDQTLKDIDRAFKALEERDELLDNIRAEIEQRPYGIANDSVIWGMKYERSEILKIINKYLGR